MNNVFESIINWISEIVHKYGLWGVFWGSIIEEIVAPVPSPLVQMSAGAFLLSKYNSVSSDLLVNMSIIALVGSVGATLGSYVMYGIGYFGGRPLVEKTSRFTGVKWSTIEKFQKKMKNSSNDELTIAILRSVPVIPSVIIAISCGILRINPLSYTISFFSGGIIRNLVFLIVGWQMGSAYYKGATVFEDISSLITRIIALILLLVLICLYYKRHKTEKEN